MSKYTAENTPDMLAAMLAIANELAALSEATVAVDGTIVTDVLVDLARATERIDEKLEALGAKLDSLDETVGASLERITDELDSIEGDLTSDKGDTTGELLSRIAKAMP